MGGLGGGLWAGLGGWWRFAWFVIKSAIVQNKAVSVAESIPFGVRVPALVHAIAAISERVENPRPLCN